MKSIFLKVVKELSPLVEFIIPLLYSKVESPRMVFIVGAPRSGSTILYQKLTNSLEFSYTDNFTHYLTEKSFIGGNYLSHCFLRKNPHNCEKSTYGNTQECGFCAPNEGSKYWSQKRKYSNFESLKKEFGIIEGFSKKPYIVKNLYNSLFIPQILDVLPNAKFIHITRNITKNIKSIVKARDIHNISHYEDWSVTPPYNVSFSNENERITFQINEINSIIESELIGSKNYRKIEFESFLKDEVTVINTLIEFANEE